ncbi:MAG: hypothetical protein KGY99_03885 [Phycisphaerae bacterium]|nr:hypothetical protein [Phycisphaerae bacterium]
MAAVVFTHIAVTVPNYREKWQQSDEANKALQAQNERLTSEVASLTNQLTDAEEEGARLENALAKQGAQVRNVWSAMADGIATIQQQHFEETKLAQEMLQSATNIYDKQTTRLKNDIDQRDAEVAKLTEAKEGLTKKLRQARADLARQERRNALVLEQLAHRDERIDSLMRQITELQGLLQEGGGGAGGVVEASGAGPTVVGGSDAVEFLPDVAGDQIRGTVRDVDGDLVGINVGRTHGVTEGMRMVVMRGSKFVGFLKVAHVKAVEAAGAVSKAQRQPEIGDTVLYPSPATID